MKVNKKFKALGFVEILIAIVVVGIISTVFLSITTNAMKDLIQIETKEYMARMAKDGMNIAQEVANQDKADIFIDEDERAFPTTEGCYIPLREGYEDNVTYSFIKDEEGTQDFISFTNDVSERSSIVDIFETSSWGEEGTYFWDSNYFLVMCIEGFDNTSRWANVKFWVGDRNVAGQVTNDSDVKDFNYYAIVEL